MRRWYAAGLGAVALLALGACSGDEGDPGTSPSSSSSSSTTSGTSTGAPTTGSPTTTATVDPADLPPEARKHTPEGAAAFVKYYIEQLNLAWTTPDSSLLPPLSDPECIACKNLNDTAVQLERDKQHYTRDPVTVTKVVPLSENGKGVQLVRLFMDQHKVDVVDSAGKIVLTDPKKKVARTVGTTWVGKSWQLFGMQ
jgi:hypothetical protein